MYRSGRGTQGAEHAGHCRLRQCANQNLQSFPFRKYQTESIYDEMSHNVVYLFPIYDEMSHNVVYLFSTPNLGNCQANMMISPLALNQSKLLKYFQ